LEQEREKEWKMEIRIKMALWLSCRRRSGVQNERTAGFIEKYV